MMDLSSLDSTLPPALADAERDMGDKFRGRFCSGRIKWMGMVHEGGHQSTKGRGGGREGHDMR